jgi:hypothetical protein
MTVALFMDSADSLLCFKEDSSRHWYRTTWLSLHTLNPSLFSHSSQLSNWNVMAHGDAREGKWRGDWRMDWVASTLHTTSEHGVPNITTADAHTSSASRRLNWRHPADLNGLDRFAERRNLVSAHVPSHFRRSLLPCRNYALQSCILW